MKFIVIAFLSLASFAAQAQESQEQRYIESSFSAIDSDGDRSISRLEFDRFMLNRITRQRAEFDENFSYADVNGDGFIDKKEAKINAALVEWFVDLDENSDEKISKSELIDAMLASQQEQLSPDQLGTER